MASAVAKQEERRVLSIDALHCGESRWEVILDGCGMCDVWVVFYDHSRQPHKAWIGEVHSGEEVEVQDAKIGGFLAEWLKEKRVRVNRDPLFE